MVRQLGLEDRVAGNMPPMPTHHAPRPSAPPRVVPPTEAVTEESIGEWIEFWKKAPQHAASDEVIARFLMNVAFMIDMQAPKEDVFLLCRADSVADDGRWFDGLVRPYRSPSH